MGDLVCVILTSHRRDCFWLCLRSLERHTDLRRFSTIYILANAVSPEHRDVIDAFKARHPQTIDIHCAPRGLSGCVVAMQNTVLSCHDDDMVVKLDEDVFVREGWLDGMLDAYERHREDGVSLVTPVIPNNFVGRRFLDSFLASRYGAAFNPALRERTVHENPAYGVWIWRKILDDGLEKAIRERALDLPDMAFDGELNINCILFGPRMMEACLPFMHNDEAEMNAVLESPGHCGIMTARALVHHYSFGPQQQAIDQAIGMEAVARYCLGK